MKNLCFAILGLGVLAGAIPVLPYGLGIFFVWVIWR